MTIIPTTPQNRPVSTKSWLTAYGRSVALAVVLLTMVCFGLSPFSAMLLATKPPKSPADFIIIGDSDAGQCYRVTVERWKAGQIEGILLWAEEHKRLVLLGAAEPVEVRARHKLINDGVTEDSIHQIPGTSRSNWDTARILDDWLKEHPEKRVRLLCNLFSSRRWSLILDRQLDRSRRSRATIEGVAAPQYDESNWWRDRTGFKTYFNSLFQLAYARWHGEDLVPEVDWSPDKYEAAALESRRE